MHFIDKLLPFKVSLMIFLLIFKASKSGIYMDNYLVTLGMYLILMLFFKIYLAVSAKD
ncbi:hypothetical protein RB2501_07825 [Robiginitalea biformata HTCC2501]|uniref:Uncharacterized protein n=1 Tax=Robiginitalea biformata (strain ATCC BAA-864 / DSM 15991 / KCTC 12146 / HTCC2501) TaxID=313596 RepID=A4CIN5_ROBBH|nr:hypothetical protein RB2501_07825 [Robiginitalea biformata HTCC2501]